MTDAERRVAIVTGGGNGIGREAVSRYLADGIRVMALDRDQRALDQLEAEHNTDSLIVSLCDVTRSEDVADAVDACLDRWARLDMTFANAGIAAVQPIAEITDAGWTRMIETNLSGVFYTIRESARAMEPGSSIVVTASTNAFWVESGLSHYNASKGGTVALVRSAALEMARQGIRVNAVAPGLIQTRMTDFVTQDAAGSSEYLDRIPLQRFGVPSDVVDGVMFLMSNAATWITGVILVIDGGQTLGAPLPHRATDHNAADREGAENQQAASGSNASETHALENALPTEIQP